MSRICIILFFGTLLLLGCKGASSDGTVGRERPIELTDVYSWVEDGRFTFRADWATPMRGERIVVAEIPNGLTVKNDSANAQLPFYGVRQVGYNFNETGIRFDGTMSEVSLKVSESRNALKYAFEIEEDGEVYQVLMTIFGNRTAYIDINSSERDSMAYQGQLEPLTNE